MSRFLALATLLLSILVVRPAAGEGWVAERWSTLTPGEKVLATDLGVLGFIGAWGAANWDYGENPWSTVDEGWFGRQTREGGADKAGHLYSSYVLGRGLTGLFRNYGFDEEDAALRGALSSLLAMTFMEFGDGFSPYGFSAEDQAMNIAGTGMAWLLARNPSLDRKIALRGEYRLHGDHTTDILTDYDRWRFHITLKPDGFAGMPEPLRWIELHAGYYARGFHDTDPANDRRVPFVGIGLSFTKLARELGWQRSANFLDYFQPPDTVWRDDRDR